LHVVILKLLLLLTVQCAYHLGYQSMEEQSQEMETPEEEEQQETGADMPTVLAEFSSVVADTQQYIVADQLPEGETQVAIFSFSFLSGIRIFLQLGDSAKLVC